MTNQRWNWNKETREPADEPSFGEEPQFEAAQEIASSDEEPVLGDERAANSVVNEPMPDEPIFVGVPDQEAIVDEQEVDVDSEEPVFVESNIPGGGATVADSEEMGDLSPLDEQKSAYLPQSRRLGRTGPFWIMGAIGALLVLFVIWLIFRGGEPTTADVPVVTPAVVEEVADNAVLPTGADLEPTPEAVPTPEPAPVLQVGQRVVVGNTGNQGIRLRNQPSLGGLTLAIYEEGDSFVVLNPGSDYADYPVEADGYQWYRIQVAENPEENLTGWTVVDFLLVEE